MVLCVSFGVMVAGALLDHAFEVKGESGKRKGGNAVAPAPRQSVDRGRQQVLPDPDPNPSIARAASGLGRSQRQFLSDTSDSKSSGET